MLDRPSKVGNPRDDLVVNDLLEMGSIDTFIHQDLSMRTTGNHASHDSVITTTHPRRFNPW
jgi:hypothetical protein